MLVIFTSMSSKKAREATAKILDQFSPRIATDTWATNITQVALDVVRAALLRHVTKNMSVACYRTHKKNSLELLWIVGSRKRYSSNGFVPVATTASTNFRYTDSCSMEFLPAMRPLVRLAALLHDLGKSNMEFQQALRSSAHDTIRHEWFSGLLFAAYVHRFEDRTDNSWIQALQTEPLSLQALPDEIQKLGKYPFRDLPPIASLVIWLIISHHKMPTLSNDKKQNGGTNELTDMVAIELDHIPSLADILGHLRSTWGYLKNKEGANSQIPKFLLQPLEDDKPYVNALRSAAVLLGDQLPLLQRLSTLPALRLALIYCRTALMLGDYNYSSQPAIDFPPHRTSKKIPYANTRPYVDDKGNKKRPVNQKLADHLIGVERIARRAINFSHFVNDGARVYDNRFLRKLSPHPFEWQDRTVSKFVSVCQAEDALPDLHPAAFVVNMASTGCGKTIGNAKIMRALSKDESLRFTVALGLRSLTLQTGDAYRDMLHLAEDDCTVSVGSSAMSDLHERDRKDSMNWWETDDVYPSKGVFYPKWLTEAEDVEEALAEDDEPEKEHSKTDALSNDYSPISILFKDNPETKKEYRARLETPIFIATIDYMMPATECLAGGRYILPLLRMMSSDIIIDEIDDYAPEDLPAIGRLVHLAGCFGRSVILSSATMPPSLIRGMAKAYFRGFAIYQSFFNTNRPLVTGWCDEFHQAAIRLADGSDESLRLFTKEHETFVQKRVKSLAAQVVTRKAVIQEISTDTLQSHNCETYLHGYLEACLRLHSDNHIPYDDTGKNFSIGVIRVAHISFCAILMHYLSHAELPAGVEIRLLAYHSGQTILLRQEEERYLDNVLHRKLKPGEKEKPKDEQMRSILDTSGATDVLFIVIATPVEEVGRDHDFDWAVIEPSSYRSIIQMSGRVLRHRKPLKDITKPNLTIMEYNKEGFQTPSSSGPVFHHPGFEISRLHVLASHDVKKLIQSSLLDKIDSTPRIQEPDSIDDRNSMIGLEHTVAREFADGGEHTVDTVDGWASPNSFFFLTGLIQVCHPFRRQTQPQEDIYLRHIENTLDSYEFRKYKDDECVNISRHDSLTELPQERLWLQRNYGKSLKKLADDKQRDGTLRGGTPTGDLTDEDFWALEKKYGMIPSWRRNDNGNFASDDLGVFNISEKDERDWLL